MDRPTDAGRKRSRAIQITILGKPECHLCHVALKIAKRVADERPVDVHYVDISMSVALMEQFGSRIPVLLADETELASGRITEAVVRRAIKRARWRRSISRILSRFRSFLPQG